MNKNTDAAFVTLPSGKELRFDDDKTYAFFFCGVDFYVGEESGVHTELMSSIMQENPNMYFGNPSDLLGEETSNDGRIWLKYNVISFHEHVDNYTLFDVIDELEKYFHIDINRNDWIISVQGIIEPISTYLNRVSNKKNNITPRSKTSHSKSPLDRTKKQPTKYNKRKSVEWAYALGEHKLFKVGDMLGVVEKINNNMQIQKFDSFINENKQQENKVNNLVDITIIKPDAQKEDILSAIDLAREHNYYGVVVQPEFVDFLRYEISNEEHIKVVAVLDFPEGEMRLDKKLTEAIDLISNGVDEIDMAINIKEFKEIHRKEDEEKEMEYVKLIGDLKPIADECHKSGVVLKLIVETGMLSMEELIDMGNIIQKSGIDYVQTSTGMNGEGAEISKIKELRRLLPDYVKIKAAGGIRTIADANKLFPYVDRIGTSVALK